MKNLLFAFLVINSFIITAQEITINGIVSDETGPLPGANIVIKGSNIGTETDFDGHYEIFAQIGDTLIFSFIGYQTKEINIVKKNDLDVELTINLELEGAFFSCYFPSSYFSPSYIHGIKYNNKGILIEIDNLYKFGQNLGFKLGYQSNFKQNNIFQVESTFNNIFYIGNSYNATFKFRNLNIGELHFNLKDYKLILNTYYKTIFNHYTKFYLGFGISNLYNEYSFGVEGGFQQYVFSNLAIYSNTTYWSNYWEFRNGIKFNLKRVELFAEHHKINNYYDFNIGIGYKFYF